VKPIHLNLASRPFRDERPFIVVVVVSSLLIAFLTLMNFDAWYRYRNETQSTRTQIATLEKQAEQERARTETLNQKLRAVDVRRLARQTQFANAIIAERAFSWSELLDHLEHVLPNYVRVESISPSFMPNGTVSLGMQCTARDADGLIKTLNQLNRDTHFANAFPRNEDHIDQGYRFSIGVEYRPSIARVVQ
jgi:Tfp pilus assembly protein PilN